MTSSFPATRKEAQDALRDFLSRCVGYASRRNFVEPGHRNVSRLSPAIRGRLLLESEVRDAALQSFPMPKVEKFVQEVWWRLYWKGWLEMHPDVWTQYRQTLDSYSDSVVARAKILERGESGVAIMDYFARELVETGYLHNHARMWFASFWVHAEKLPWELGAAFFLRHLLDGDAASNTLSWRWVAGLHTQGKTYLVRRSNIEHYCHPDILNEHLEGLERLEAVVPAPIPDEAFKNPPPQLFPEEPSQTNQLPSRWGLWIHEDDLSPERSELANLSPASLRAFTQRTHWSEQALAEPKIDYLQRAIEDGAQRAGNHYGVQCRCLDARDLGQALATWANEEKLDAIVTLKPFVGPLHDQLAHLAVQLERHGVALVYVRRQEDWEVMQHARRGFFGFWKKTKPKV